MEYSRTRVDRNTLEHDSTYNEKPRTLSESGYAKQGRGTPKW